MAGSLQIFEVNLDQQYSLHHQNKFKCRTLIAQTQNINQNFKRYKQSKQQDMAKQNLQGWCESKAEERSSHNMLYNLSSNLKSYQESQKKSQRFHQKRTIDIEESKRSETGFNLKYKIFDYGHSKAQTPQQLSDKYASKETIRKLIQGQNRKYKQIYNHGLFEKSNFKTTSIRNVSHHKKPEKSIVKQQKSNKLEQKAETLCIQSHANARNLTNLISRNLKQNRIKNKTNLKTKQPRSIRYDEKDFEDTKMFVIR